MRTDHAPQRRAQGRGLGRPIGVAIVALTGLAVGLAPSTVQRGRQARRAQTQNRPIILAGDERPAAPAVQDPQDRPDSAPARRAGHALALHRALQHLPYYHGHVRIELTGAAPRGRAVLTVTAPDQTAARRAYRAFLHRYHDDGRMYRVRCRGGQARPLN